MQSELAGREVEFTSGGGKVTVTATGDQRVTRIRIDPLVVDPGDVEMLEDLVLAAVDGALSEARDMAAKEMAKITAGLPLPPGMKLPFG
ncbi:MAG: YbaB/EbfC family nucleoid-associated protein, partial [Kiritimatiellia bacterium]|nr:YbaB/EbfC family nucleoid-associated protein [Kiritimatiellia bacterium]